MHRYINNFLISQLITASVAVIAELGFSAFCFCFRVLHHHCVATLYTAAWRRIHVFQFICSVQYYFSMSCILRNYGSPLIPSLYIPLFKCWHLKDSSGATMWHDRDNHIVKFCSLTKLAVDSVLHSANNKASCLAERCGDKSISEVEWNQSKEYKITERQFMPITL